MVEAVKNYNDPAILVEISKDLRDAMPGINSNEIEIIMSNR